MGFPWTGLPQSRCIWVSGSRVNDPYCPPCYQYLCNRGDEFSISTHIFLSKDTHLNVLNTIYVYLEPESQIDKQTGLMASPCRHRPHNWWCNNGGNRGDTDMSPLLLVTRHFLPKFPVLCIPEVQFLAELE